MSEVLSYTEFSFILSVNQKFRLMSSSVNFNYQKS